MVVPGDDKPTGHAWNLTHEKIENLGGMLLCWSEIFRQIRTEMVSFFFFGWVVSEMRHPCKSASFHVTGELLGCYHVSAYSIYIFYVKTLKPRTFSARLSFCK